MHLISVWVMCFRMSVTNCAIGHSRNNGCAIGFISVLPPKRPPVLPCIPLYKIAYELVVPQRYAIPYRLHIISLIYRFRRIWTTPGTTGSHVHAQAIYYPSGITLLEGQASNHICPQIVAFTHNLYSYRGP